VNVKGLTDYITNVAWEDTLIVSYVLVDEVYQGLDVAKLMANRKHGHEEAIRFSDSEVITLCLFAEMVFAGAEDKMLHFIRQYHLALFPRLLDNSRFNRRRRQLAAVMEQIRLKLRDRWRRLHPLDQETSHLRLVDSAPISICTYMRGSRCQSIPLEERDEWFGVCTTKRSKFFGPRCHLLTTLDQMVDTWLLAPGSYDDRRPVAALVEGQTGLAAIGDKGYVDADLDDQLWQQGQHLLLSLKRDNQKQHWPAGIQALLCRLRHDIETAFSVLTTVFTFELPKSRSFSGLIGRITTKILAHTLSFFLAEAFSPT
jgi:hypothetical protein